MAQGINLDHLDNPAAPVPSRSRGVVAEGSLSKDYFNAPPSSGGKSRSNILNSLSTVAMQQPVNPQDTRMPTVDVKCNYARDRVEVLCGGKLILKFDQNGICKMPVHEMELLRSVQRARPGRFVVVTANPEPVVAPAVVSATPVDDESEDDLEFDITFTADVDDSVEDDQSFTKPVKYTKKSKGAVVKTAD